MSSRAVPSCRFTMIGGSNPLIHSNQLRAYIHAWILIRLAAVRHVRPHRAAAAGGMEDRSRGAKSSSSRRRSRRLVGSGRRCVDGAHEVNSMVVANAMISAKRTPGIRTSSSISITSPGPSRWVSWALWCHTVSVCRPSPCCCLTADTRVETHHGSPPTPSFQLKAC